MHRFEKLDVFKLSAGLSSEIFTTLEGLRNFGFRDQIGRSSLSIPSNIAEGYERDSSKEAVRFMRYAKGSAGELRAQIYIGMKAGYIAKDVGKDWLDKSFRISAMLSSLIIKLKC